VPYHCYVQVSVRLMRQGQGADSSGVPGSGYGVEFERTVRIEEPQAREVGALFDYGALDHVARAVRDVLDEGDLLELHDRWRDATENMTADKMRAALEVLER
jgi:hypothetical protein